MRNLIAISFCLLFALSAKGQTTDAVSGTIDIASVLNLTVTSLTGVVSFDEPADYSNGQTINNAGRIIVKSNVSWLVTISAQSAYFQAMSSGASTNMPASVLGLRRNGTTTFLTMSTSSQTLKTGTKGGASASGNTFDTDIRINPGFGYNAGTYNIGVLFTLSQQ